MISCISHEIKLPAMIPITIVEDSLDEGIESFRLRFNGASSLGVHTTTIYIIDNDAPTLDFKTTNFNVSEGVSGGKFDVEVELSESPTNAVTFEVELNDGTALKDTDFTDPMTTNFTITASATGQDLIQTISIPITTDTDKEGNETFNLKLKSLTGATFSSDTLSSEQTITIVDDENPTVKFTSTTMEVDEDVGTANLPITLSGPTANEVTVTFATSTQAGAGHATATNDFITPTSGTTAPIQANQLTGVVPIMIVDDGDVEDDESFTVTISSPTNADLSATAADLSMTVTIKSDDLPELTITAVGATKEATNGTPGTANFTITSNKLIPTGRTIHYLPVGDSFLPFGISNKAQMATNVTFSQSSPYTYTLEVALDDDTQVEANGTVAVTLLPDPDTDNPSYSLPTNNISATVNVEDDDAKIPVLSVIAPTNSIPESAGSVEFTIRSYDDQAKSNSITPGRPITLKYTPDEVSPGDFLTNSVAGTATTAVLKF